MDSAIEQQIMDRLTALELKVKMIVADGGGTRAPDADPETLEEIVLRMHPSSLSRALRAVPKDTWARTFYRSPRAVIEKLKLSVSKNSWNELVEDWKSNQFGPYHRLDRENFMNVVHQLEEMGEIVLDSVAGAMPEVFITMDEALSDFTDFRARQAETDKLSQAERDKWFAEELGGLV